MKKAQKESAFLSIVMQTYFCVFLFNPRSPATIAAESRELSTAVVGCLGGPVALGGPMMKRLRRLIEQPEPLRFLLLRFLDRRLNFLSYPDKLSLGTVERPHYGHSLLKAAELAAKLGHSRISAIEFGVAGGNGLLSLEDHAAKVKSETGVTLDLYGFDTSVGMPPPQDFRDMPYMWEAGYFAMEPDALRARLKSARLVIGPVEQTVPEFCTKYEPAPIGFIGFDLDYYSSTRAALQLLDEDSHHFLPRVVCYFDDTVGDIDWAYNDFTGELLAIREFNEQRRNRKVGRVQGLRFFRGRLPQTWHEQIYVAHFFDHPDYGRPISGVTQHPLAPASDEPKAAE